MVKSSTLRFVLALAVSLQWEVKQLDISNVFLHGILDEEFFMEQPRGFIDKNHPNFVCKLHKSLYGLKLALPAWIKRFSEQLLEYGFIESTVDYSLFTYTTATIKIFVLVYVTGSCKIGIDQFITQLKEYFHVKDLG